MNREQALAIAVGDELRPRHAWNATERPHNHLPKLCVVEAIERQPSQTGVLFQVRNVSGVRLLLDAGWFHAPEAE